VPTWISTLKNRMIYIKEESKSTLLFYFWGDVLQECGDFTWRVSDLWRISGGTVHMMKFTHTTRTHVRTRQFVFLCWKYCWNR